MIQRIQTLFLLAAAIVQIVFISLPISRFVLPNINVDFYAKGFKNTGDGGEILLATGSLFFLCWAIVGLTLVTIFLYKKRILQIRFCIYNMLINLGLIGMLVLQITNFLKNNPVDAKSFTPALAIPVVSIILLILAFRGIRKDELLVKAYDRLR